MIQYGQASLLTGYVVTHDISVDTTVAGTVYAALPLLAYRQDPRTVSAPPTDYG